MDRREFRVSRLKSGVEPTNPNEESMTEEQNRRRLGHIHDFIMRTICEVDVGRSFLYAVEMHGGEGKTERDRTFELMVCYYLFLCAARLLEKNRDALGLKDLKYEKYSALIREPHIRNRILALVDEADKVGKPLREFRSEWVVHVGKVRHSMRDFKAAATAVMQITKEINSLLCEARKLPCPTVDEYLERCREIREAGRPEHEYVW